MRPLRIVPENTRIRFTRVRFISFAISGALLAATLFSLTIQGLNLGIDFRGGVLIEAASTHSINIGAIRDRLRPLNLGPVEVQRIGNEHTVLIRIPPPDDKSGSVQQAATAIKAALGPDFSYRKVEAVGPRVGDDLFRSGLTATVLALGMIALYVTLRFEWQFGVAALVAIGHDVVIATGLYSILQLDFDMVAVAALLTLAGYSINDTIVVFDRLRENLVKYKAASLRELIDRSCNETLSRTIVTSGTTLLAALPMVFFGGSTLYAFALTIVWGVAVGTFSSIYVASVLLLYLPTLPTIRERGRNLPSDQKPGEVTVRGKPEVRAPQKQ